MKALQIIGLWISFGSSAFVEPIYPPNAISGGTVVAALHSVAGKVEQIEIPWGEEPFLNSAKSALEQWRLHPDKDSDDLVIVHFRQPNIYYLKDAGEKMGGRRTTDVLPYPKTIIGPAYPAQILGQGAVILRMEISAEGRVAEVQTVKSAGSLTDVSIEAVRQWEFEPAEDYRGEPKASSAYAVLVYRFPLTEQKK